MIIIQTADLVQFKLTVASGKTCVRLPVAQGIIMNHDAIEVSGRTPLDSIGKLRWHQPQENF